MDQGQTENRADAAAPACEEIRDTDSDGYVHLYRTVKGNWGATAYRGARAKPVWRYWFDTQAERDLYIAQFFALRRKHAEALRQSKALRNRPHTIEIGHIFVEDWGYGQTNIKFYQVTRLVGRRTIEVRRIADLEVQPVIGHCAGKKIPLIDQFIGEATRHLVDSEYKTIKTSSYPYVRLWNGKPMRWSGCA